ncbi:MAG TPA: PEP-CTERM sorting domain-containing protein [Pirellulales bacterium]|jgi:hypothetical protein
MKLSDHIKTFYVVAITLATTLLPTAAALATPISTDGFAIKVSPNIDSMGGLSQSLLNSLTLVAEDRPTISITNDSTGADITGFSITMGNSTFAFGSVIIGSQASTALATSFLPTNAPGTHANSPTASLTFSGFSPNQIYDFRLDLDRVADHGASLVDYKQAFASGSDPSQWATVNVTFSDGQTLSEKLTPSDIQGAAQNPTYSYFYCLRSIPAAGEIVVQSSVPTPEPSTWLLAAMGGVGLLFAAVRRRRQARSAS